MIPNQPVVQAVINNGKFKDKLNREVYIIEEVTGAVNEINSDHKAIHDGYGLCAHLYLASLVAEAKHVYRFKGPSTLYAHIKNIELTGQGAPVAFRLIKGATVTVAGSEVTGAIQNLNDNSDTTPESALYDTNVEYTGGTIWCEKVMQGSTGGPISATGSFAQNPNQEYITKTGSVDYILELENLSTTDDASYLNVNMFFYEEPSGLNKQ